MVNSFTGKYDFLSNFYLCSIPYDGLHYPSSEHAFQAAKTTSYAQRVAICNANTPGQAKRAGKLVNIVTGKHIR